MTITAADVKALRERTGVGMMDAKKALTEAGGDMEVAVDALRQKGLAKAAKKADRATAEGLVVVATSGNVGAVVEINAETDFVARNEKFQEFARTVAQIALEQKGDLEKIMGAPYNGGDSVQETLTNLIATIGENMTVRRAGYLEVDSGAVAAYMHNALEANMGKIGVLVALESNGDAGQLDMLGKQIAMHVAATNPQALTTSELDQEIVERERNIFLEQAKESGKPQEIAEKMVEGRLRKFYEEVVLLEQTFVIDGESKVGKLIEAQAKEVGGDIAAKGYLRFELGEGVDKGEAEDFAAEVKKMAS